VLLGTSQRGWKRQYAGFQLRWGFVRRTVESAAGRHAPRVPTDARPAKQSRTQLDSHSTRHIGIVILRSSTPVGVSRSAMSTHSRPSRRALLRARVLHEPYWLARLHVLGISPTDPVVPAASDAQVRLEGAVFHGLGYLHAASGHADDYRLLRLLPTEHSLDVWVTERSERLVSNLAGALPTWYRGDGGLANGHPGLRYRHLPGRTDALEFFLIREHCALRVHGVDVDAFDNACTVHASEPDLEGGRTGYALSIPEVNDLRGRDRDVDDLISPLIRRIGALGADDVRSIDIWRTNSDVLSVELFTGDRSERTFHRLLADLTSPHLRPRMTVTKTDGAAGYRTILQVDGHASTLHVRIQSS
jgi:hypothetical protein